MPGWKPRKFPKTGNNPGDSSLLSVACSQRIFTTRGPPQIPSTTVNCWATCDLAPDRIQERRQPLLVSLDELDDDYAPISGRFATQPLAFEPIAAESVPYLPASGEDVRQAFRALLQRSPQSTIDRCFRNFRADYPVTNTCAVPTSHASCLHLSTHRACLAPASAVADLWR